MARPGDGRGGGVRGRPPLRPRRIPARGLRGAGLGALGAGVRPHRLGQDAGGRLRRAPGPGGPRQGLLHHAAQGAVEPEVRGTGRHLRGGARRAADRRHHAAAAGAGGRHDHRGAAQHAAGGLGPAREPAHGRARRGPLHSGPLPGRGLGGGARPLPTRGPLRLPLGHREQRRRARRLAALGPGGHLHHRRAPPADRPAPPLRRAPPRGRRDAAVPPAAGERATRRGGPAHRPGGAAGAPDGAAPRTGGGGGRACPTGRPGAPRWSRSSSTARCCRRSSSSSAAPPATMRCARSSATACA